MKLNRRNLTSCGVALALMSMSALQVSAALNLPKTVVNGKEYYYYTVSAKETIYSITRKLGVTREDIVRNNPSVIDGLRASQVLVFPVDEFSSGDDEAASVAAPAQKSAEATEQEPEIASEIATEPEPEPEVTTVPPVAVEEIPAATLIPAQTAVNTADDEVAEKDSLNIAVVAPFMLDAERTTRDVESLTDFYRGMLLAIDEKAPLNKSLQINLWAYDNEGSADRTRELMKKPEMDKMDYIIAPKDSVSIEEMATVADATDAVVLNLFAVQNKAFQKHESVAQTNIPHVMMYQRATSAFVDLNRGRTVVILNATDLNSDKAAFVEALKSAIIAAGLPYEQVDYTGKLSAGDLDFMDADKEYVFVSTGGSRETLLRFTPALTELKGLQNFTLFGFPEWVILPQQIRDTLHKLDTTIYSRFSTAYSTDEARKVIAAYNEAYGQQLNLNSTPCHALWGYDVASWLIYAAQNGITEPYKGIQNSFRLIEDEAGDVNSALYFINYNIDGTVSATLL